MQAPIDSAEFVRGALLSRVAALPPLFHAFDGLEDGHVAQTLLRSCLMYLLRVSPPDLALPAAELFDSYLENSLRLLVGGVLPASSLPDLVLSVRMDPPNLGIGLTSVVSVASSDFMTSLAGFRQLLESLIPSPSQVPIVDDPQTLATHADWASRVAPDEVLPLEEMMRGGAMTQRELTGRVFKCAAADAEPGDLRRRAHRASLGVAGAKDWLFCKPPGLQTRIPDRDFRYWLRFHCGIRLFNDEFAFPRDGCPEVVDRHGDHLLTCHFRVAPGSAPLHWRHDLVVRVLTACLRRASRNPTVEPDRAVAPSQKRPDKRVYGVRGGLDYLDISILHPLTSAGRMQNVERWPKSILNTANTSKQANFHDFIASVGAGASLHPIVLSSLGGWHPDARNYFANVCNSIASSSRSPLHYITSIIFHRVAARLVGLNCRSLTDGTADFP